MIQRTTKAVFVTASILVPGFLILPVLSCTEVSNTWEDLKKEVTIATNKLILCPFNVSKPEEDQIVIEDKAIALYCSRPRQCRLQGKGAHIRIRGSQAKVILKWLVFQGATDSAVVIESSSTTTSLLRHTIKGCIFRQNAAVSGVRRGGAVRTGEGTRLRIDKCKFTKNRARYGAAISHEGTELSMSRCRFNGNRASARGIVQLTAGAKADIGSSEFVNNIVRNKRAGGSITAVNVGDLVVWSGVTGLEKGGTGCSGLFLTSKHRCYNFDEIPYKLGELTQKEKGILISQGLTIDIVARAGNQVRFKSPEAKSTFSSIPFHGEPDGAAVFELEDGGYTYVSNAEVRKPVGSGGVYGVEFDRFGRIRNYKQLLGNTTRNCNGGITPWNTWVSCEEYKTSKYSGQCYQVHPQLKRPSQVTVLGGVDGGWFEAFAYDNRNVSFPEFYVTEDLENGTVRRFRPNPSVVQEAINGNGNNGDAYWNILHHPGGTIDYLEFLPNNNKFHWTSSLQDGQQSAFTYYKNVEGIIQHNGKLLFVSKKQKQLFILDLDRQTYAVESTRTVGGDLLPGGGSFGHGPDQLVLNSDDGLIYFTEDGGKYPGIFAYDGLSYRAVLEADDITKYANDETTGVAFSPDGTSLFFCIQDIGIMFRVQRIDGRRFVVEGNPRHAVLKWQYDLGR